MLFYRVPRESAARDLIRQPKRLGGLATMRTIKEILYACALGVAMLIDRRWEGWR